jgi:DNA-binding response OmpR family regulator
MNDDRTTMQPWTRLDLDPADRSPEPRGRVRTVLVVEDEAPLRSVIRRNLERRGIVVHEARSAEEALTALSGQHPDLLLLDINLPDRTGWDLLRELRITGRVPRTIVVSAVRVSPERLSEFAVDGFLPKPFPIESLIGLVAGTHGAAS